MNLRQKAKHYKQMYEKSLAKTPVHVNVSNHKIDKLRAEKFIDYHLMNANKSYFQGEEFKQELAYDLSKCLLPYMECKCEFIPRAHAYKFTGDLSIVCPWT